MRLFDRETNTEQSVRKKFTLILFLCSICVLFIHTNNLETYGLTEQSLGFSHFVFSLESFFSKLTYPAVNLFFLISGILFFRTFAINDLWAKWKRRFFSIGIPYIIWCTVYYLLNVCYTNIPLFNNNDNTAAIRLSVSEWLGALWVNEYYTLWFLKNLIIFILLTPVIWVLLKNRFSKIPTGLIILTALIVAKQIFNPSIPCSEGIELYLVGSYLGINCRDFILRKYKFLSVIACLYLLFMLTTRFQFWNIYLEIIYYFALWYASDFIRYDQIRIPWWMTIYFFTYVAHDAILEVLEKCIFIMFGTKPVMALLDYFIVPVLVELILIGIAYLLKKYTPKTWRVISGGR